MLLLGLPWKQNCRLIECSMLLMFISAPKLGLQQLRRLLYGLLPMAKLAEPLMRIRDTSKVQNQNVTRSRIVLVLVVVKIFVLV